MHGLASAWKYPTKTLLLSVVALAFFVSRILSSSFKIELFGEEILRVESLDQEARARPQAHAHTPPPVLSRPSEVEGEVFVVVEQMPQLLGGLRALQQKINYPEIAGKAGIEGRVIVQFIVDKQGRVTAPRVIRGLGGGCDEEALRVVREARFRPGFQRGRPVNVKMTLPITFRLR